ncbi:zinc ribbon domain-containing protein [Paracidovorax valerianellae]|uniref:zinc ribbon domain-containing protein n=1 Tax=Paracidovorax valerianellae TaxID=187868 RepID=UPI00230314FC|nr:zinc ribbon domain-containing protein [Paracidovorax valerianellae]MDA8444779.1 zinc ribbon domain-containing protein [Paracidovorax valerianellae]
MAMVFCRECKKQVSSDAPTCPHCGVQDPGKDAKPAPTNKDALKGLLVLCVIVVGLVYACSDSDADKAKQAAASKAESDARAAAKAKADAACMLDLACIGEKGTITASIKCPSRIERLAKGAVKWTDGTLDSKFSHYRWKDKKSGIVTHIGDKAQFQNGFGAYINVIYACDLDMKVDPPEIVNVDAVEGRL